MKAQTLSCPNEHEMQLPTQILIYSQWLTMIPKKQPIVFFYLIMIISPIFFWISVFSVVKHICCLLNKIFLIVSFLFKTKFYFLQIFNVHVRIHYSSFIAIMLVIRPLMS